MDELQPVEHIPDTDSLYRRVHKSVFESQYRSRKAIPPKYIPPGAFNFVALTEGSRVSEMSTDWSARSTPEETRGRGRRPEDNHVLSASVAAVKAINGLSIEHTPKRATEESAANPAHVDVINHVTPKDSRIRADLAQAFDWILPNAAPIDLLQRPDQDPVRSAETR